MTQISTLINGCKNVIRIEDHSKYINAPQATSHIGYAGTSSDTRSSVAERVRLENPQQMTVEFKGEKFILKAQYSKSGKTVQWRTNIPESIASKFVNTDGTFKSYDLVINGDCTVQIDKFVRKSETAMWRHSLWQAIDEAYINIVEA